MAAGGIGAGGDSYGGYRTQLVETLRGKGVRNAAVLRAIAEVPRHLFVPPGIAHRAYEDSALPIAGGQTISQPYVQARSLEAAGLTGEEKVLEIGTGSGYQTALLARLASMVFSVERVDALARGAREVLQRIGVRNVSVMIGDGTLGWGAYAPYDAIIVSAASPDVPQPLLKQLAPDGRLVIPLGDRDNQVLMLVRHDGDGFAQTTLGDVRFVPLLGQFGFDPPTDT